jgi:geranylgeranyl pyrophosphate synthase
LQLSTVYEPVNLELAEVNEQFRLLVDRQKTTFPELYQMLSQVLVGGKIIRPTLTLLCGKLYNHNRQALLMMATASELLHIATLVHDDAVDKAGIRRGRSTINKIWGIDKAIVLGDYLFARAGEFAAATGNLRVVKLFAQTLETISQGELRQDFSAFSLNQTFEKYLERIAHKTASLFAMATESGAALSQAQEEMIQVLKDYGYNLGIAFQIVDDVLDFTGTKKDMGKPVGSDLAQGTITLPSLLLLERYPKNNPIINIFNNRNKQQEINRVTEMIRNSTIIEECYKIAFEYSTRACRDLNLLPDNNSRKSLLFLADYVLERNK